jgi:hypothetical protein
MLNGYSGYRPPSFYETADHVRTFPSASSVEWLQARGVTHIYVQLGAYDDGLPQRLETIPALHHLASDRGVALYALDAK